MSTVASEPVWHYTSQGQRKGPVSLENLQTLVSVGRLNLQQDMVWNPEMGDWAIAGSIKELAKVKTDLSVAPPATAKAQAAPSLSAPSQQSAGTGGLYQTPRSMVDDSKKKRSKPAQNSIENPLQQERTDYPGVGRLGYFFIPIIVSVGVELVSVFANPYISQEPTIAIIFGLAMLLVYLVGSLYPIFGRLSNLMMSGWYFLLCFVPFANLWIGYRMFACPPGYAQHKKMDGIGIVLAILYWLTLIAAALLAIAIIMYWAEFKDEFMKAFKEELERQSAARGR